MTALVFSLLVALGAFSGGLLGALTGLGGGIIIVPMLTLFLGVDLRYAIGASLVAVIATSSGAAAAYVKEGYTNVRVGMLLEIATTLGALGGAYLALRLSTSFIAILFAIVLLYSAWRSMRPVGEHVSLADAHPLAVRLRLNSDYPTPAGRQPYAVRSVPGGFLVMGLAGLLSALLGIGSGIVKVIAMDQMMGLPFKVSTTTSNFMIGVTAAASAGVYLQRGYIDPTICLPVVLGVLAGALLGARILGGAKPKALRVVFSTVVVVMAIQMLWRGVRGAL
jgi:uncharacterized protein